MIRAGKLKHRIAIEKFVQIRDPETGGMIKDWRAIATVWAAIEPLRGREFWASQAMQSETTVRIRIRAIQGVDSKCRVRHDNTHYAIITVINPELAGVEMQLLCKTGVIDG